MTSTQHSTLRYKAVLTLGFLCVTAAIVTAYSRPATGYELSMYASTPELFWAGVGVGLLAALAVVLLIPKGGVLSKTALGLASMSMLAIVGLPVLRSYAYYGGGDSLSHLGWAREIRDGVLNPIEFLYPAVHLIATFMSEAAGVELTRGLVLIPTVVFPLVSVIFFGLCLKTISDSQWALPIGIFAGLLFVPINNVSVHVVTHPSSQTILFVPVALYALFRYLTSDADGFPLATPDGLLLALVCVGIVLLHPQETMSFLVLLLGVFVVQKGVQWYDPYHPIQTHRPIGAHVVLTAVTFFGWTVRNERARSRAQYVVETFLGGTGETLQETTGRTASLVQLGGSIEELFFKLFAVALLFCLLAGALILSSLRGRFREVTPSDPVVAYLAAGLVPLGVGFLVIFFADQGDHYFRFMGFMMVPVTLLGAIALSRIVTDTDRRITRAQLSSALGILFVVMLALQFATIHPSPYIYQGNMQVTDQALEGHSIAFEHHDDETPLMGIRQGQYRYVDAHFGWTTARGDLNFPGYRSDIPQEVFNQNLTSYYDEDQYVVLTDSLYTREIGLYQELRYTDDGFQRFERDPQIHRIQDNGEFRLYRLVVN